MTRKDYLIISRVIREVYNRAESDEVTESICEWIEEIVHGLKRELKTDNPNFNEDRWLAACYGDGGTAIVDGYHVKVHA